MAEAQPIMGNLTQNSTYAFVIERYRAFKDWNDEKAKWFGAVEGIKQTFEALTHVTNEGVAARTISKREAAVQIGAYSSDELAQLDMAKKSDDADNLIQRNLIKTSGSAQECERVS